MMDIEIRSDGSMVVEGYVNAVDRFSRELYGHKGKFIEKVEPNVFKRALEMADSISMLLNHDSRRKLADTKDGSLELVEDAIGLRARAIVTDPEVIQEGKKGNLKGWSFGFRNLKDSWEEDGEIQKRTLHDIDLMEVSLLTITPAYIATSVSVRSEEIETRSVEDAPKTAPTTEELVKDIQRAFEQQMLDIDIWLLKNKKSH